jgi:hypothetical protein
VKLFQLIYQTRSQLPQTIAKVVRQRQQPPLRRELEAGRLDRIRNPAK